MAFVYLPLVGMDGLVPNKRTAHSIHNENAPHGPTRFTEAQARHYFRQLIEGVEYCHSQGVCHRDLKPENLLLDANRDLKVKADEGPGWRRWCIVPLTSSNRL